MSSKTRAPPRKRHRSTKKQLTDFEKGQIIAWREEKISIRQISKKLRRNPDPSTVSRFLKRFEETNSYQRKKGSGRKRKTTSRDDRAIVREALKKRRKTAGTVHSILGWENLLWDKSAIYLSFVVGKYLFCGFFCAKNAR